MFEYMISPVLMEGTLKETVGDRMKIHLRGRLGVLTLPRYFFKGQSDPVAGDKVRFYFSYIQVVEKEGDYDINSLKTYDEVYPCLVGGKISMYNDTAVEVKALEDSITIFVPRRWVFTQKDLDDGLSVEFYISAVELIADNRRNNNEINNSRRYAV